MNRKALGQHIIHKATSTTSKKQPPKNPPTATKILKSPSRKGKGSPQKIRRDNTYIEFECDTSISLSSDDTVNQEMTQSPHMPPAKKIDRKNTPPQENLPTRRSTRTKTSAFANKFGNAIPINTIANDTTADNEVCHIMMQRGNNQNGGSMVQATGTTHESSTDIDCIDINANDETPEQLRIEKTNDWTEGYLNSIRDTASPKDALCIPTMTTTNAIPQQDNPSDKFVTSIATSKQSGSPQSPNPRAISSRYVIDRPTGQ